MHVEPNCTVHYNIILVRKISYIGINYTPVIIIDLCIHGIII